MAESQDTIQNNWPWLFVQNHNRFLFPKIGGPLGPSFRPPCLCLSVLLCLLAVFAQIVNDKKSHKSWKRVIKGHDHPSRASTDVRKVVYLQRLVMPYHRMLLLLLTRHSLETDNIYCCCFAVNAGGGRGFISDLDLGDAWRAFIRKTKYLRQLFTSSKFRMNQIKPQLLYSWHLWSLPNKHPSFLLHGATQLFNAAAWGVTRSKHQCSLDHIFVNFLWSEVVSEVTFEGRRH